MGATKVPAPVLRILEAWAIQVGTNIIMLAVERYKERTKRKEEGKTNGPSESEAGI